MGQDTRMYLAGREGQDERSSLIFGGKNNPERQSEKQKNV